MKIAAVAALAILMLSVAAYAQSAGSIVFDQINLVGKGVAVSTSNTTDVHFITVAVARMNLAKTIAQINNRTGVNITLPPGTTSIVTIGVFHFDKQLYKLKNVNAGNDTVTADIYDKNGTVLVGSFNLQTTTRAGRIIWVGTLSLNGNNYNAYILEAGVRREAVDVKSKISDYCSNHPTECKDIGQDVNLAAQYCENHPTDTRCLGLEISYCRSHLDDARCRQLLLDACKAQPNREVCKEFCAVHPGFCGGTHRTTAVPIVPVILPSNSSASGTTATNMNSTSVNVTVVQSISANSTGG